LQILGDMLWRSELDPAVMVSALMVPVVDDNFPEKSSVMG